MWLADGLGGTEYQLVWLQELSQCWNIAAFLYLVCLCRPSKGRKILPHPAANQLESCILGGYLLVDWEKSAVVMYDGIHVAQIGKLDSRFSRERPTQLETHLGSNIPTLARPCPILLCSSNHAQPCFFYCGRKRIRVNCPYQFLKDLFCLH